MANPKEAAKRLNPGKRKGIETVCDRPDPLL